jgi:integrase/recombinase XerD
MKKKHYHNYIEFLKLKGFTKNTVKIKCGALELFFKWIEALKGKDFKEVTREDLIEYHSLLILKGYALNTIDTKLRSIKTYFDYLEKNQEIFFNPFEKFDFPKLDNRLPKDILTEEEVKKLLCYPKTFTEYGLRNRAIMELLYSTALRNKECVSLSVYDLDLESGYVRVNQGKGKKDRVIPLGKKACEYIKLYLKKVRIKYATDPDCKALFLSRKNKRIEGQSINLFIKKYGRQLNFEKPVTTHSFRRATVTHMLKNNAHPLYLQRMLGHSTDATLRKYLQITISDIKKTHQTKHPSEVKRKCS